MHPQFPNQKEGLVPNNAPTLFGLSLNRLVAFAGPYLAIASGAVADWLLVHVHLLGIFHTTHGQLASAITQGLVFTVTAAVVWLGHQKWLDGFQKWAYQEVIDTLSHQPLTLESAPPVRSDAFFVSSTMGADLDPDDFGKVGDEPPPEAAEFDEADPKKIPVDVSDATAGAEIAGSSAHIAAEGSPASSLGPLGASVTGLGYAHRIRARDLVVQAAFLGLRHAPALHYTQDARRWEGISRHLKAWRGQFPKHADCSAFATWCLWQGLSHYGVRDVVNGANWRYGYTGTMVKHGKHVTHESNIMRGDLALYGDPFGGTGHVAICIGGGKVISFGSEAGPFLLDLHYRSDLREVRRYI